MSDKRSSPVDTDSLHQNDTVGATPVAATPCTRTRKRKRNSGAHANLGAGGMSKVGGKQRKNNNSKKNHPNIIICGGKLADTPSKGTSLSIPSGGTAQAEGNLAAETGFAINPNVSTSTDKCNYKTIGIFGIPAAKTNQENFPQSGRKNYYHKIHFKHVNGGGGRARRLQIFPTISKFFLPDKRPRKEIIVPPTKFLLGGNISDPLNLNSLKDETIAATINSAIATTPKSSPMTTPPKVEVIIPPNIFDPLHLLDPVDSIEYEKQLTSPMKKITGAVCPKSKKSNRNKKKHHNRVLRNHQQPGHHRQGHKGDVMDSGNESPRENDRVDTKEAGETDGEPSVCAQLTDGSANNPLEMKAEVVANEVPELLKVDIHAVSKVLEHDDSMCRKRRISEGSGTTSNKNKIRRMDSSVDKIVSPVIPQPGALRKRSMLCGAQGGPIKSRVRTQSQSAQSVEEEVREDNPISSICDVSDLKAEQSVCVELLPSGIGASYENQDTECSLPEDENKILEKVEAKNKVKKRGTFQYGNYDRYYGYRNLNEVMDVRLKVFMQNPSLFKDKDILDIGCNVGHLTTAVAKYLSPKSVLGIDIDPKLIRRAKQNVSVYVRLPKGFEDIGSVSKVGTLNEERRHLNAKESAGATGSSSNKKRNKYRQSLQKAAEFFPQSFPMCYGLIPDAHVLREQVDSNNHTTVPASIFPYNIKFRADNYVLRDEQLLATDEHHKYDLIMCLSVTKWVHLNFGDSGLKRMFRRIFNQLRPGGKLILEAQNWASYKKKKKLTERIFMNYQQIEFFPNNFHEYLLSPEVGFSHSYPLGVPRHLSKGFRRPIQLYVKGDFTPSQLMWSDAYHPQTPYTPYRGIYATAIYPPPRFMAVWGGGDSSSTPHRSSAFASTSQYYNPLETDSYLPSYETELVNRRYCFQSPLYSAAWSPPTLCSNPEIRTPPKHSSLANTPRTPSRSAQSSVGSGSQHRHVYPPDEPALNTSVSQGLLVVDSGESAEEQQHNNSAVNGNSLGAEGSPEY